MRKGECGKGNAEIGKKKVGWWEVEKLGEIRTERCGKGNAEVGKRRWDGGRLRSWEKQGLSDEEGGMGN